MLTRASFGGALSAHRACCAASWVGRRGKTTATAGLWGAYGLC